MELPVLLGLCNGYLQKIENILRAFHTKPDSPVHIEDLLVLQDLRDANIVLENLMKG